MSEIDKNRMYTIKQAAEVCNLGPMWVRRMVQEAQLEGCVQHFVPGTTVKRWEIPGASLAKHVANAKQTRRTDGATKYTAYAKPDVLAKLQALATANGLDVVIQRANTPEGIAKRYARQKELRKLAKVEAYKAAAADKQKSLKSLKATVTNTERPK